MFADNAIETAPPNAERMNYCKNFALHREAQAIVSDAVAAAPRRAGFVPDTREKEIA